MLFGSRQRKFRIPYGSIVTGVVVFAHSAVAQKASLWTGKAANSDSWSEVENWDPKEVPEAGDTVMIPKKSDVSLAGPRTVALLETRGDSSGYVSLSGGDLTVTNGLLWKDTVFYGVSAFSSSNVSVFNGLASFGRWDVTLGGSTTFNGTVRADGAVAMTGAVNLGESNLTGRGTFDFTGALVTKEVADPTHRSVLDPAVITGRLSLRANQGVIEINPKSLENTDGSHFQTKAGGEIRLIADEALYENVQWTNHGKMDVTDQNLETKRTIRFKGANISDGGQPVVLGSNSSFGVDGSFAGHWIMRGKELYGTIGLEPGDGLITDTFIWEGGTMGYSVTNDITGRGEFVIRGGATLEGELQNNGYIVQESGTLIIAEGTAGGFKRVGTIWNKTGGSFEIGGDASVVGGATTSENSIRNDGTLLHRADSASDHATIGVKIIGIGGLIKNEGGRLTLGSGIDTRLNVSVSDPLGLGASEIRQSGSGIIQGFEAEFADGGVVTFADRSRSTRMQGTWKGRGQGRARLSEGVLKPQPFPVVLDFSNGAVFEVSRATANAPDVALAFLEYLEPFRSTITNRGSVEWSGGVWTTLTQSGERVTDGTKFGRFINESADFRVLKGNGATQFESLSVENRAAGVIHIGEDSDPNLELLDAPLTNEGRLQFNGDGRLGVSGDPSRSKVENSGVIEKVSGSGTSLVRPPLDNKGLVRCRSGTLNITGAIRQYDAAQNALTGGNWIAEDGGTIKFGGIPKLESLRSGAILSFVGVASGFQNSTGASLPSRSGMQVESGAEVQVRGGGTVIFGGELKIDGGILSGEGTIGAPTTTVRSGGEVSPGNSPGTLTLQSDVVFQPGSRLRWEWAPTGQDRLEVLGEVQLGGDFVPQFLGGAAPQIGESFTVLSGQSIKGTFDGMDLGSLSQRLDFDLVVEGTEVVATVKAATYADFADYRERQFNALELLDPAISGAGGDPEFDGWANLLEYVLGLSAKLPDEDPLEITAFRAGDDVTAATLDLTFPWYAQPGKEEFRFRYSADLQNWSAAGHEVLSDEVAGDHRLIRVRVTAPQVSQGRSFFQLAVEE